MLKQLKKFEAADCREAHAIEYNLLALEIQRHISPGFHVGRNEVGCVGIIAAQKFERTLGKHNAEPPCRVRRVLFVQCDFRLRVALFPKVREIKAGRASAQDGNAHVSISTQARTPPKRSTHRREL